jgi:NADH-quinone oxidoreductase subunit N
LSLPITGLRALSPLLFLLAWATSLLLLDAFLPPRRKAVTAALAAVGLAAALVLVGFVWATARQDGFGRWIASDCIGPSGGTTASCFGGMLRVDGFALFLQGLFALSALLTVGLARDYLPRTGIERGEFYSLVLFATSGMMLMAAANDLIIVFLALELLSIPLYVLAGLARPRPESEESAMKYFLLGAFATGFVVYGTALVFGAVGSTNFGAVAQAAAAGQGRGLLLAGSGLVLVGLGFKVAAVPFHMWTPDVYQGAPSVVTAFMSVGAKAGGVAGLLRLFLTAFAPLAEAWAPVGMWLAAATMTWGNVAAIAQSNVKRLLAYSSIAHAGYLLMAFPVAAQAQLTGQASEAAAFYLLAYAVTNLGAWGVVLALERAEGRGLNIEDYAGLASRRPGLALAMALFMLSLTGLPPTVGFIAKYYVFRAAIDAGYVWLALVGVLTSLVSAYYYLRVVVIMWMREGEGRAVMQPALSLTVALTALATFIFGLVPNPLVDLATRSVLAIFR